MDYFLHSLYTFTFLGKFLKINFTSKGFVHQTEERISRYARWLVDQSSLEILGNGRTSSQLAVSHQRSIKYSGSNQASAGSLFVIGLRALRQLGFGLSDVSVIPFRVGYRGRSITIMLHARKIIKRFFPRGLSESHRCSI